jgi:DNA-binding NarL/FixJ family response regulator
VTEKLPTRVLIADDHALVRAGIRALLEKVPAVEVVAEAADGREALDLIRKHQPHVVLMDIAMPGINGLEATRLLGKTSPATHIMILSMHSSEEYVWQALRSGARGYLLKGASLAELELAIKSVAEDQIYLSPSISKSLIEDYLRPTGSERRSTDSLTPRQREILQMIAEGKSTKQIALDLNISVKTVDTHRSLLMKRLNVHDVARLVRYAVKIGLINLLDFPS